MELSELERARNHDRSIALELSWWSEAVLNRVSDQMQKLEGVFANGLQESAAEVRQLRGALAGQLGGAPWAPGEDPLKEELQGIRSELGALRDGLRGWPAREEEPRRIRPDAGALQGRLSTELQEIRSCVNSLPGRLAEQLEHDRRERQTQVAAALERDLQERRHGDESLEGQLEQQALVEKPRGAAGAESREPASMADVLATHEDALAAHHLRTDALASGRHLAASEVELALELTSNGSSVKSGKLSPVHQLARDISHHPAFFVISGVVVLASSIVIGVEADEQRRFDDDNVKVFRVLDFTFISLFIVELAIRWTSAGIMFLSPWNVQFYWNVFDTVLVLLSLLETVLWILSADGVIMQFLFLRLARLLRLARMMRMVRAVRQFKELRIMVNGILNCVKPLIWALLLMLALTYMTAVFVIQMVSDYLQNAPHPNDRDDREVHAVRFIERACPSVLWTMYSLFKCLTGGDDWGDFGDVMHTTSIFAFFAFLLYVVLGMFCILNLITAVFLASADRAGDLQEEIYSKKDWMFHAREFFGKLIKDVKKEKGKLSSSEQLDEDDFVSVLNHTTSILFLEEHGLDLFLEGDARVEELFALMDYNRSGSIDMDEFLSGLYLLKGSARALDVRLEHSKITGLLEGLQRSTLQLHAARK